MTTIIKGELEVDSERGVIWFHTHSTKVMEKLGTVTVLRICQLPKPIPLDRQQDITMSKTSWKGE